MKIILDCNIWISFLLGFHKEFMRQLLTDSRWTVVVCDALIEEIHDVVIRPKITKSVAPDDVEGLMHIIDAFCHYAVVDRVAKTAIRDADDIYLLSLAESTLADFLISGDADLTVLGHHKKTLSEFKARYF